MGCSVLLIVFTWLFYRMSKTVIRSCHVSNYIIFCVDETEAIPLIRPRGRPNPKLYAAVRKLMVCYYSCSNLQHTLPLKRVRARSSVSISTEEAQNYASLWWSAYWPLDKDYLLFESCVSLIFSKRNKKKTFFTFLSTYQVNILERNRGLTAVLETVTRIITGAVTLLHYSMVSLANG